MPRAQIEHEIHVGLREGVSLTILFFSDREARWLYKHRFVNEVPPGTTPDLINDLCIEANYVNGDLAPTITMSMHIILPGRLGQQFLAGLDISPGAKTYLEFIYERRDLAYDLVEICRAASTRVRLDNLGPALVRPIGFPFPIPLHLPMSGGVRVPILTREASVNWFEIPVSTRRYPSEPRK